MFQNASALEAVVDALEVSGLDRATLSVLATNARAVIKPNLNSSP